MRCQITRCGASGIIIILTLLAASGQSQPLAYRPQSLFPLDTRLSFRQELNIYEWAYALDFRKALSKRLSIDVTERFQSTLQTIQTRDLWKDSQAVTMGFKYTLSSQFSLEPYFVSRILNDELAGFDNDVRYNSANAKLGFQVSPHLRVAPEIAGKWQTQLQRSDHGLGYALTADLVGWHVEGSQNDLSFYGMYDSFGLRKNGDLNLQYKLQRQFYEATADTLVIFFDRLRRDSFDLDGDSLFVRNLTQSRRGLRNALSYRLGSHATFYMRNRLATSSFQINHNYDTRKEQRKDDQGFESDNRLGIAVNIARWFNTLSYTYRYQTRDDLRDDTTPDPFSKHPSVGFDTKDILVGIELRSRYHAGSADSLGLYTSVSKFEYTTTDSVNRNDHDQIRWQTTFAYRHRFSPVLSLVCRASAFLSHFVFVDRKLSSNNNWERVIQLVPEIIYHPSANFYSRQIFVVRSKYQTFDFDEAATSNRNITNRYFIFANQTKFAVFNHAWMDVTLDLELAEQGRLFIGEWKQTLALSWRNYEVQAFYRYRLTPNLVISPGGHFYRQVRWQHQVNAEGQASKTVESRHTNFGPVIEISYRPSPALQFVFYGNIQRVKSSQRSADNIHIFDVNLNWYF
jgi:hypothetical protein